MDPRGSDESPHPGEGATESCPYCERLLETPYCCVSCGQVFSPERDPTPFEAFGLPLNYGVDTEELERRLLRYSRLVHPDFFATASEEMRRTAEEISCSISMLPWVCASAGAPISAAEPATKARRFN